MGLWQEGSSYCYMIIVSTFIVMISRNKLETEDSSAFLSLLKASWSYMNEADVLGEYFIPLQVSVFTGTSLSCNG